MRSGFIKLRLSASSAMIVLGASAASAQMVTPPLTQPVAGSGAAQSSSDPTAATTADTGDRVADIVVTAERREASLQSVPIAVTALGAAQLANGGVQVGADLERFVPSLKMTPNITSPTNLSPSLRGSGTQDAASIVAESPFGIYIDDVFVGSLNGNNTTLADVERVEVLRGPQGTLYGRNTLAGAVKFITRVPGENSRWLDVTTGYGNYNQYLVSGSVGGPLTAGGLAGSASFQFNGRDGYGRNRATSKSFGDEDNYAGRVKLHYTGIDRLNLSAWASYAHGSNDGAVLVPFTTTVAADQVATSNQIRPAVGYYDVNVPAYPTGPYPLRSKLFGKTGQLIASVNAAYELGDDTVIKSITGYVDTKDRFSTDLSGIGAGYPIGNTALAVVLGSNSNSRQYTQEFQLQGSAIGGKLSYIGGLFYLHSAAHQELGWYFLTPASQTFSRSKTDSVAGYGQLTYELVPNLKATAGLRYTKEWKDFDVGINVLPTSIIPSGPIAPVSLREQYDAWTPKFGLDYQVPVSGGLVDKLLIYGTAGRGFRSGGFNGINIFDLSVASTPYRPETNWTYEGGIKADLIDHRVRLNVDYFVDRIKGLLLNATVAGGTAFPVQNAGSATIKGFEYELTVVPVRDLNLFVTGSALSGKFRTLNPTSAPAQAITLYNITKPETPQTPGFTITAGGDYTIRFPVGSGEGALRLGGDYYYTSSYTLTSTNDLTISLYDRINAYVAFDYNKRVEMKLQVKNLENNRSFITGSRALGGFIAQPPRTIMFTVSYKR